MVPGLHITDCAGSCHSSEHRRTTVNAIDMTGKTFFERLYLVPGSHVRVLPHPRRSIDNYFSILVKCFGPSIFLVITIHQVIWPSPGTLERACDGNLFKLTFWYKIRYPFRGSSVQKMFPVMFDMPQLACTEFTHCDSVIGDTTYTGDNGWLIFFLFFLFVSVRGVS